MSQLSKWKTIGYSAAIFIAGAISGGALGIYTANSHFAEGPHEQEMAQRIRTRLQARLGLSPDQAAKINPIVDGAISQLHAIRIDTAQRVKKIFDDAYAQVSALLTPEQRVKLEEIQRERRERMEMQARGQDGHHHPPGPGGPHPPGPPGP